MELQTPYTPGSNWAELSSVESPTAGVVLGHAPVIPFADKYPIADNPPVLTENQRSEILRGINLPQLGPNEIDLALSRIEFDADYNRLSRKIEEIVSDFRAEKLAGPSLRPEAEWRQARKHSDELARRELLASTSALANLDAKIAAAKAAQAEATALESELNSTWLAWNATKALAEKLNGRIAIITGERDRLNGADYDAAIRQLYTHQIDPQPGVTMGGNLTELIADKQLRNVKLAILTELESKLTSELKELRVTDRRLSKTLGKPAHGF